MTVEVSDEKPGAVKQSNDRASQSPLSYATCKMLDCDTISQAKAKALDGLYANTPFSCRPSLDDVELCERCRYIWLFTDILSVKTRVGLQSDQQLLALFRVSTLWGIKKVVQKQTFGATGT